MQGFINYYNSIISKIKNIELKRCKNIIFLKDGFINFKIDLNKIEYCPMCGKFNHCDYKKCHHIYAILIKYFNLDFNSLLFIWKHDNYHKLLKNEKLSYLKDECCICLCMVDVSNNILCLNCGNVYHYRCLNSLKNKKCLNCLTHF